MQLLMQLLMQLRLSKQRLSKLRFNTQRGYTLIELMLALSLGIMLTAGLLQVFQGSKKSYNFSSELARMQENARYGLDLLAHDIRMIGYQGCADPASIVPNVIARNPPSTDFSISGLQGFKVTSSGISPSLPSEFTSMTITNRTPSDTIDVSTMALVNTDMIMVQYASPTGAKLTGNTTPDNGNIQLDGNPANIQADDVIMISDCQTADIIRANNVSTSAGTVTIAHSIATNTDNKLQKPYPPGAQIMTMESNLYFVAPSGRDMSSTTTHTDTRGDTINALYRVDIHGNLYEIVQGVDALVLQYGEKLASGNIRYYSANTSGLDMTKVVSIKVGLLMHSIEGIADKDDTANYNVAGTIFSPTGGVSYNSSDRRLRQVFSTTVQLRNRS